MSDLTNLLSQYLLSPVFLLVIKSLLSIIVFLLTLLFLLIIATSRQNLLAKTFIALCLVSCGAALGFGFFCLELISIAKVLLAAIMLSFSVFFFSFVAGSANLRKNLNESEMIFNEMRDVALLEGIAIRMYLAENKAKLAARQTIEKPNLVNQEVLKSLAPLVMLFWRKEKSIIQWAMAGINITRTIYKHFKQGEG